jgi:hypothetical protein
MRYVKENDSAFLFLITHNGALKVRSRITIFVWVIGIWNLEFIWNLVLGAWNFNLFLSLTSLFDTLPYFS